MLLPNRTAVHCMEFVEENGCNEFCIAAVIYCESAGPERGGRLMKKKLLPLMGFCLLAVVLLGVWYSTKPEPQAGMKHIVVEVVHSDGSEKEFAYDTEAGYLGELLKEEGLISGTEDQYGIFVDTVDGETAVWEENGAWWSLSCNGEAAQTGVDQTVVEDGAVYTWSYTVG